MNEPPPSTELTTDQLRAAAEGFASDFALVRTAVARVMVGQTEIVDGVLTCLFVGGHALLEGVPGIGKTLLVRTLARAVDLGFARVQFTPDLMPADITGTAIVTEMERSGVRERAFAFQRGPVFTNILLADEINRATPKTQSALLEAMQERAVTSGGVTHQLPEPFIVLATQNPIEQEGTYPLPEAQLDRFFFKLLVQMPSRSDLAEIIDRTTTPDPAETPVVLDRAALLRHQRLVRAVAIAPHVRDYAVRLVLGTHPAGTLGSLGGPGFSSPLVDRFVRLGASPRAAQTLVLAAKCRALLGGRFAASIEDLRSVALPALRHRLILNFEASAEGASADAIIDNLLTTLPLEAAS
mgnify:CR=1 FL=1